MNRTLHHLVLALLVACLLPACVSPVSPLPRGTKVHFINCMPTTLTVQTVGLTAFGNKKTEETLPELHTMMKRVVMEEAARAGLDCSYSEQTAPRRNAGERFLAGDTPDVPAVIDSASAQKGFVATPWTTANYNRPAYLNTRGFGVTQTKVAFMPAAGIELTASTMITRFDKAITDKKLARVTRIGGNHPIIFFRFTDDKEWKTALPSSKANAMKIFELQFRTAVAQIMGNPNPVLNPPIPTKRL